MNVNTKYKIGVVGVGMVGEQVRRWFLSNRYAVVAYDKYKNIGNIEDLNSADLIFLCLPSAYDKKLKTGVDITIFKEVISFFKDPKIFVIKSTVPPGTTEILAKMFSQHKLFHSPEFLTEVTAWEDFSKPTIQLLGFTRNHENLAKNIIKILPKGRYSKVLTATATETFKYMRNAFFATKVIFVNQIYDLCKTLGIDYEQLRAPMLIDPWMGGNHTQVVHKGYRGFGGKCLPKDLKTFIKACNQHKVSVELLKVVDKINDNLIKKQKLTQTLNKYWLKNSAPKG